MALFKRMSKKTESPANGSTAQKPAQWNFDPLDGVKKIVAVASGKGGVGKSTTTVNLARALAAMGARVGVLDADIYGPSVPRMMGLDARPEVKDGKLQPLEKEGIQCLSMGLIAGGEGAVIWRGPMLAKALAQMLRGTAWGSKSSESGVQNSEFSGDRKRSQETSPALSTCEAGSPCETQEAFHGATEKRESGVQSSEFSGERDQAQGESVKHPLDFLLIDMPPGTGDVHLSIAQQVPLSGAIIVTTPQEVATQDALKCAELFNRVRVPLLGVVENMSGFVDPQGTMHPIFGEGGGKRLATRLGTSFLGEVPINPDIGRAGDEGAPLPESAGGQYAAIAARLLAEA